MKLLAMLLTLGLAADLEIVPGVTFQLADRAAGRRLIGHESRDPFFDIVGQLDRELRLGEPLQGVPVEQQQALLLKLYDDSVIDWSPEEGEFLTEAARDVAASARERLPGFLPDPWIVVATNGSEEAGGAYTRGQAIILPIDRVRKLRTDGPRGKSAMAHLLAHETAHVFTRSHPEIAERLYHRLGFRYVGPVERGPWLESRRITNPDGPRVEHLIRVNISGKPAEAALIPYATRDHYDPRAGRRIFDYLRFALFPVEPIPGSDPVRYRVRDGAAPVPYPPLQTPGFLEQVGRNTEYVLHPDEIVADNLAQWLVAVPSQAGMTGLDGRPLDVKLLRDLAIIVADKDANVRATRTDGTMHATGEADAP